MKPKEEHEKQKQTGNKELYTSRGQKQIRITGGKGHEKSKNNIRRKSTHKIKENQNY